MSEQNFKVDGFIPCQIVFDDGRRLSYVGIICAIRGDGCYEISFPSAHCFMSAKDKAIIKLPEKEGGEAVWGGTPGNIYKLEKRLMPRRVKRDRKDAG